MDQQNALLEKVDKPCKDGKLGSNRDFSQHE